MNAVKSGTPPCVKSPLLAVRYSRNNGSVPPPYRRATTLSIAADGAAELTALSGYDRDDPAAQRRVLFDVDPTAHAALTQLTIELGVFARTMPACERPPVGGGTTAIMLMLGAQQVSLPTFPADDQDRALRDRVAEQIRALVPADLWQDVKID